MTITNTDLRQLTMTLEYRSKNNNADTGEVFNATHIFKNTDDFRVDFVLNHLNTKVVIL